jgi:hypothetical protein
MHSNLFESYFHQWLQTWVVVLIGLIRLRTTPANSIIVLVGVQANLHNFSYWWLFQRHQLVGRIWQLQLSPKPWLHRTHRQYLGANRSLRSPFKRQGDIFIKPLQTIYPSRWVLMSVFCSGQSNIKVTRYSTGSSHFAFCSPPSLQMNTKGETTTESHLILRLTRGKNWSLLVSLPPGGRYLQTCYWPVIYRLQICSWTRRRRHDTSIWQQLGCIIVSGRCRYAEHDIKCSKATPFCKLQQENMQKGEMA